jgi:hypothetical protein
MFLSVGLHWLDEHANFPRLRVYKRLSVHNLVSIDIHITERVQK